MQLAGMFLAAEGLYCLALSDWALAPLRPTCDWFSPGWTLWMFAAGLFLLILSTPELLERLNPAPENNEEE